MDEFPKVFIVGADNVGSKQMQQIRISLRGKGELLMGKNTMMRKAIRGHVETNPDLEKYFKIVFCIFVINYFAISSLKTWGEEAVDKPEEPIVF